MKVKRIAVMLTAVLFAAVLFLFCAATVLLPKKAVSESERRRLAAFPSFSWDSLFSGAYADGLSDYVNDHFALRETLRTMNTSVRTGVFLQQEVGGVIAEKDWLYAPQWPLDEQAVRNSAEKLQAVIDTYFPEKNVCFSVIPDKADFASTCAPRLDTQAVVSLLRENLTGEYIDILDTLEKEDYYRTDTHWRQERLADTAAALVNGMGLEFSEDSPNYTQHAVEPFYGVLWGKYAMPIPGDTLVYLTSPATESAVVYNLDHPQVQTVYDLDTASPDLYDIYLSGASSFIEIESPLARTDRHLVLFRDSFGSSLAPWLLTQYKKITMIDIRYMASAKIGDYADLESADDILFLYSTSTLNTGGILK